MGAANPHRRFGRKTAAAEPLAVYNGVIDTCHTRAWRPLLFYDDGRWTCEVRDRGELLARVSTTRLAPYAFQVLGQRVKVSLERGKMLEG